MTGIDLFEILRPPLQLNIRFGLLSAKFDRGKYPVVLEKCNIRFRIWIIAQILILILFIRMYLMSLEFYSSMSSILEWLTYISYFILDVIVLAICMIASKYYNGTLIDVINKILSIELDLNRIGVELDYAKLKLNSRCIMIIYILVNIFHLATFSYADYTAAGDISMTLFTTFTLIIVDYTELGRAILFCCMVLVTANLLKNLNQKLDAVSSDQIHLMFKIKTIAIIYEDIFDYFRDFVQTFSMQLLFDFGVAFSVILFQIFDLIILIFKNELAAEHIITLSFAIGHLLNELCLTTLYVVVSERYYSEVSYLVSDILFCGNKNM